MTQGQKTEALSPEEAAALERNRSWVRDHYAPGAQDRYETMEGKLTLLEAILANSWIGQDETWKLQSLGVTFGDALAQRFNLQWVMVEDEHGRDPALQDPMTTILLFPRTSISKRIERGESVDIRQLFEDACRTVTRVRTKLGSTRPH